MKTSLYSENQNSTKLTAAQIAGSNSPRGRPKHDFFATDPRAVEMLMDAYTFNKGSFLEPCVGMGHISEVIKKRYPNSTIVNLDIVDRGYPDTVEQDFLSYDTEQRFDNIITNPPYSLAKEFVEKGISLLASGGKMAMFLKIQFLESQKRANLFRKYPPKYIYVFTDRMSTWRNGEPFDEDGKKWSTTICHAWFVWEKDSKTEPVVRWL
jgi:hypothetical protein